MLFRKHFVSTRTLLQLAVALILPVAGTGAALAANSGIAPLLVPYTVNVIAGTPQFATGTTSVTAGYFGEGVLATPTLAKPTGAAVLNGPFAMAVDSVGNVYITDKGNDIIREVNAQTGFINTIAGVLPKGCSGSACTIRVSGCADGVPAYGAPIGSGIEGIAVDAYGNVYFDDNATSTVSVIYRGGTTVADFIKRVNPAGVATSGGNVLPGYVYHVGGTINLTTCSAAVGNADNLPAFLNSATGTVGTGAELHGPALLTLDSAGNIYIADISNSTVRVINTQETAQTFFQFTVQPGYMRSITNCNAALTVACPTATTTATANTGINGPVDAIVFNSQYKEAEVDAFGNIYQLNGTGSGTGPPGIYAAAAYAGGAPLTNLLTAEAPSLAGSYSATIGNTPNELPLTYGNSYIAIGNPSITSSLPSDFPDVMATQNEDFDIRPSSLLPDNFGTFWYMDNHYPELSRIDQYTSLATLFMRSGRATANISPLNTSPASFTNPYYCVYGNTGSKIAWTQGPQTYDPQGDGCPAVLGYISGGDYQTVSDGLGNIYVGDGVEQLERIMTNGNIFPATAVGTSSPVTQGIQIHFNSNNPPVLGSTIPDGPATGYTSTSFAIAPGISDFTINTTTPEFPLGSLLGGGAYGNSSLTNNFQMWAGLPTCTQLGAYPTATGVTDYDCLVYVTFNPTAPGIRQSQLVVTTANGSVYNIALYGVGNGSQLAIDGGVPSTVGLTGIGTQGPGEVAVSQSGVTYVADPGNNRVIAYNGTTQTTIGSGLSAPMGVAVDSANNVYIADTGNNRVIEVNPITNVQTVLGNYSWIPGSTCYTSNEASDCPAMPYPSTVSATTAPPQYAFKGPQSVAVDKWNNVYVADTGNSAVVEITSNIALGGAVKLLNYSGAPKFSNPVAVTVDSLGNIYVADPKAAGGNIIKLPPGGGDLVTVPGSGFPGSIATGILTPVGVAVDAGGDVYVSDTNSNTIEEIPAVPGSGPTRVTLNFPGIGAPGNLALDASGNLYAVDTKNKLLLFDNRQNPLVNFGNVAIDGTTGQQPLCVNTTAVDGTNVGESSVGCPLTLTNVGNAPLTLTSPLTTVSGSTNAAFGFSGSSCGTTIAAGSTCQIMATFNPTADGGQSENVTVNGGPQSVSLVANGVQPLPNIVLSASYTSGSTPAAGATATITATLTQPAISGNVPSGTVTFTYVIDSFNNNANNCAPGGSQTVAVNGSGVASFQLPTLAQGLTYTVTAVYNGDSLNSANTSAPLTVTVPGTPVTVTISSTPAQLTFLYGGTPPVPVGTVTPTPPAGVTVTFGSNAKPTTPISNPPLVTYPVIASFSGTGACAYGNPIANYASGAQAFVTENPAPLSYVLPNFSALYGAPDISYGANAVITGLVNGDLPTAVTATFTPAHSSILNVGTYTVTPTLTTFDVADYAVTAPPSTLTITKAPVSLSVTAAKTAVANTAAGVATATYTLNASTAVGGGIGIPTGTVTVYDEFTPTISTTPPVAAPILLPSASNPNLISISDVTTGASIYYTLGTTATTPTSSSTAYSGPVTVAAGQTLSVIAIANSQNSNVVTLTQSTVSLTAGVASYVPTNTTAGIHQYSFAYSGDSNFQTTAVVPSATAAACIPSAITVNCLVVDTPDFTLTSNTGPVVIIPGVVPSGNGLPAAPNQSTAAPETAVLFVNAVLGFTGTVSLSCQPQSPSYVSCFMTPTSVCFATTSSAACTNTATSAATVVAISTPATLPLGFKTSEVRSSTARTVLAFLPFGVLAFCVRRRRRLSKALWTLIAVIAVGAVMSGCGGNQVDFYTPIPTGAQTVTVTATYQGVTPTGTVTSGSPSVTAVSSTSGLFVGQVIAGGGIPSGTTITSIGSGTITLSANATASATAEQLTAGSVTRQFVVPIAID